MQGCARVWLLALLGLAAGCAKADGGVPDMSLGTRYAEARPFDASFGPDQGLLDSALGDQRVRGDLSRRLGDRPPRLDAGVRVDVRAADVLRPDLLPPLDSRLADTLRVPDMNVPIPPVTFVFPASSDTTYTLAGCGYFWNAGDYVQGTRATTLSSASQISGDIPLSYNGLVGDVVRFAVVLNGVTVGTVTIGSGVMDVPYSMTFASVGGPSYTLIYRETNTVAALAGSIALSPDVGKVTLTGP